MSDAETISPPDRVTSFRSVRGSIDSFRNATCPSTNDAMMPLVCGPPAARLLFAVELIGCHAVTNPCDWWLTQVNELHPSLSVAFPHQLWFR